MDLTRRAASLRRDNDATVVAGAKTSYKTVAGIDGDPSCRTINNFMMPSPNASAERRRKGSNGVQLSSATRERLYATRNGYTDNPATSNVTHNSLEFKDFQNGSGSMGRSRRLSGNPADRGNNFFHQVPMGDPNNGYRSDSSILSQTLASSAGGKSVPHYNRSTSDTGTSEAEKNMRYANSLESLDAVASSIQQARAYSLSYHNNGYGGKMATSVTSSKGSIESDLQYSSTSTSRQNGNFFVSSHLSGTTNMTSSSNSKTDKSSSLGIGGQALDSFSQRTFPLRKSQAPSNQFGEENWTSTKAETTAAFWTPSRRPPTQSQKDRTSSYSRLRGSKERLGSSSNYDVGGKFVNGGSLNNVDSDLELHRLRGELREEQDKVQRLSAQLNTNAHVVSAFEHSLANMTNRLEQLKETSENKDKELHDLRQLINNLKEKSDFSGASRWKSDDNMLTNSASEYSVTTGAESDQESQQTHTSGFSRRKKNTWFRSSLTKAFGRNKSSSHLNGNGNANSNSSQILYNQPTTKPGFQNGGHRSISTSALDDPMVDELQRQLSAKDDLLTETRLEALSSASQLQTLREQVAKLRSELRSVRRENEELKIKMTDQLSQNISGNSFSVPGKNMPKDDALTQSSLLLDVSKHQDSFEIPVIIVITAIPIPLEIRIGCLKIRKKENFGEARAWRDLDMNVQCLFGLYLARLDPFECLGLSGTSAGTVPESGISGYTFMGYYRTIPGNFSDVPNTSQYISGNTRITLKLNVLHEAAFATLRPLDQIRNFINDLGSGSANIGLIAGNPGTGKSFAARRLAECLIKQRSRIGNSREIETLPEELVAILNFDSEKDLTGFFHNLSLRAKVVIIENVEDFQFFRETILPHVRSISGVHFLVTSGSDLTANDQNKSWPRISLSTHDRLESSFLGYLLRRRVLSIEAVTLQANDSLIIAVNWLNRIHSHLADFCARNKMPELPLKFFISTDIPLESAAKFRSWFVDLWNLTLVEEMRRHVAKNPGNVIPEDPVKIVVRSWPWKEECPDLPQALRPLLTRRAISRQQDEELLQKDPLMDMLMCLQEATKDSGKPPVTE